MLFKPRRAYFGVFSLLGPALATQENIYSGTVNTDNRAMMSVLSGCPYYPGVHIKLALWKNSHRRDLFDT